MPVTIGGLSSGLDTNDIIDKLVQVEAKPIEQWVSEKDKSDRRKNALEELKNHLTDLNDSVKDLYGHRASYDDKKAISSDQNILEASANKLAEKGIKEIKVKELASTHKISTDKIGKDDKLSPGKIIIEVNGESQTIRFKGGSLASLRDRVSESASDIVDTAYINTNGDKYILTIESKIPGKKGEIVLSGDKDFLKKIGLVKGEKGEKKEEYAVIFDSKYFTSYTGDKKIEKEDGALVVDKDGRSIKVDGVLWREYILPAAPSIKKDTILEVNIDYIEEGKEEEHIPYRVEIGPEEEITIKGINLKGYNISRIREIEKPESEKAITDVIGIGVVSIDNGQRTEKIYEREKDVKGKQILPIGIDFDGRNISKMIFYCNAGSGTFSNANIITPVKGTGILEAKNTIKESSDAKLELDGIEIVRDRNNNLNDVIKGVNLNLKQSSDEPITVRIEPDIEKAIDKIKRFVKSYNEYLDLTLKLTKTALITKPEMDKSVLAKARANDEIGLFVGDMTLLRLENSLKTSIGEAYPSRSQDPIKILAQTGISTGAINSVWESIKEGKLVMDEDKLYKTISGNPEGIHEFFGSDNDGDNKPDNGLAYRIQSLLNPFLVSGKNILALKIDLENESIKSSDERIAKHKEHLKKYEEKLRSKFSAMEKSISDSKAQGNWLKMNLGIQDSDNKRDK